MRISVEADFSKLQKNLTAIEKQDVPYVASLALNDLAFNTQRKVMPAAADRKFKGGATNYTKRGFVYEKANKRKLYVDLYIADAQKYYLEFMIAGGTRFPQKKYVLVPGQNARLDKRGNFRKGQIQKILADKQKYFQGTPKGQSEKPNGIWERYGRGNKKGGQRIRLVALYADDATYRPIFPFGQIANSVVFSRKNGFGVLFRQRMAKQKLFRR